jgi:hypothetical protein
MNNVILVSVWLCVHDRMILDHEIEYIAGVSTDRDTRCYQVRSKKGSHVLMMTTDRVVQLNAPSRRQPSWLTVLFVLVWFHAVVEEAKLESLAQGVQPQRCG